MENENEKGTVREMSTTIEPDGINCHKGIQQYCSEQRIEWLCPAARNGMKANYMANSKHYSRCHRHIA